MDRIAAKVAQKVAMLFENENVDAGAREKIAGHDPCRTAADDAALRLPVNHARTIPRAHTRSCARRRPYLDIVAQGERDRALRAGFVREIQAQYGSRGFQEHLAHCLQAHR